MFTINLKEFHYCEYYLLIIRNRLSINFTGYLTSNSHTTGSFPDAFVNFMIS